MCRITFRPGHIVCTEQAENTLGSARLLNATNVTCPGIARFVEPPNKEPTMTNLLDLDPDRNVPFPDCGRYCAVVRVFGVGECESICPSKFDVNGRPLTVKELTLFHHGYCSFEEVNNNEEHAEALATSRAIWAAMKARERS